MSHKNIRNNTSEDEEKSDCMICDYLNAATTLYWRIDITENDVKYFNDFMISELGAGTFRILRDMAYAQDIILAEDFTRFQAFMDAMKKLKSASVLVRIKTQNSTLKWLRLSGNPDPCKTACCFGVLSEDTDLINETLSSLKGESSIKNRLNIFDSPVFLARFSDRRIVAGNRAALACCDYTENDIASLSLEDLLTVAGKSHLHSIYESLIFKNRWNGNIVLTCKDRKRLFGQAAIRAISDSGENLLWISIRNLGKEQNMAEIPGEVNCSLSEKDLLSKIGRTNSIEETLSVILENQPLPGLADALLYSRVDISKNQVTVCGAGTGLDKLEPGVTHHYAGSIAENIINYQLSQLIVKETSESIKPIDWALFIPMGIRSYYAKPFYENDKLNAVLIFCSSKSDTFDEENTQAYQGLFPVYLKGLEKWKN
jgi:hypothetical protein